MKIILKYERVYDPLHPCLNIILLLCIFTKILVNLIQSHSLYFLLSITITHHCCLVASDLWTNPDKPVKGGLWNKSQCNTIKITHTSVTIHKNQVKSVKHLHMKFYVQSELLQLILGVYTGGKPRNYHEIVLT